MDKICPDCGNEYKKLGSHLYQANCSYPTLSSHQYEVVTGVLMGDGCIDTSGAGKTYLQIESITEQYLHHLDELFGVLSNGVRLVTTADESARYNRKSGFHEEASADNYNDVYKLSTMRAPCFDDFLSWYDSGKKVFPKTKITPTILKNWYACDGTMNTSNSKGRVVISAKNEWRRLDDISDWFAESELPRPRHYDDGYLTFTVADSDEIFDYMGDPLPGFEYKWKNY